MTEELLTPHLKVKTSTLPGAGKGLFTKIFIAKGALITEHTGNITNLKDADQADSNNAYLFYVNRNHVIDAKPDKKILARYANDASGMTRIAGIKNNAQYVVKRKRVFIVAVTAIEPGGEILVGYGKQYWDTVKKNMTL